LENKPSLPYIQWDGGVDELVASNGAGLPVGMVVHLPERHPDPPEPQHPLGDDVPEHVDSGRVQALLEQPEGKKLKN
jgi:hypothetical protein